MLTLLPKTGVLGPSFGDFKIEEGLEGVLSVSSMAMVGIFGMEALGCVKPGVACGLSFVPGC